MQENNKTLFTFSFRMQKFLLHILLFICSAIPIYILTIIIMGNKDNSRHNLNYRIGSYGHMYSRLNEIDNYKDIDILFIGSSHSYRGFDPRIFSKAGYSSFNLGSSFQTPIQTNYLLKEYLSHLQPKIVVLEVFPAVFSDKGVESTCDLISNSRFSISMLPLIFKHKEVIVLNTMIYSAYREYFIYEKDTFIEDAVKNFDTYIFGGYVEKSVEYVNYADKRYAKADFKDYQLKAFQAAINYLDNKDIPFILVQAPVRSKLYKNYTDNQKYDSIMLNFGEYYNFNEILELKDSIHFFDQDHLNQSGVEIMNNYLIDSVLNTNYATLFQDKS